MAVGEERGDIAGLRARLTWCNGRKRGSEMWHVPQQFQAALFIPRLKSKPVLTISKTTTISLCD